ncbi:MAG: glycosyltransferase family 2 protein [Prevotellaceae bacterium]|nr:glycosyltransferase family 2 protein [Prevotellaceae bacterium]
MNYSVIIPFRGSITLLRKALNSIPDRDDIQIIVVDNNPTAADITCFPHPNRSTLLVLRSNPEKGAGHARNVGLDTATGKFILFLDADDYFTEDAFDYFDKYLDASNDITYFKATSVKLSSDLPSNRHVNICKQIDSYLKSGNEDWVRFRIENPICKLFLRSFLESGGFRFEEVKCSNDTMFSITTGYYAKKIGASDSVVYTITEGSVGATLTSDISRENQFIRFGVSIRRNKFLEDVGKRKYRIRLLPSVYYAFAKWGFAEGWRYVSYALKSGSNIFVGYLGI